MKPLKRQLVTGLVLVMGIAVLLLLTGPPAHAQESENHCFTCHTNPRKLIQITREIEKSQKGKPGASAETEGEG